MNFRVFQVKGQMDRMDSVELMLKSKTNTTTTKKATLVTSWQTGQFTITLIDTDHLFLFVSSCFFTCATVHHLAHCNYIVSVVAVVVSVLGKPIVEHYIGPVSQLGRCHCTLGARRRGSLRVHQLVQDDQTESAVGMSHHFEALSAVCRCAQFVVIDVIVSELIGREVVIILPVCFGWILSRHIAGEQRLDTCSQLFVYKSIVNTLYMPVVICWLPLTLNFN